MRRLTYALLLISFCALSCSGSGGPQKEAPVIVLDAGGGDSGMVVDIQCGAARVECSGECVDPSIDSRHCSTCGAACSAGTLCSNGQCLPAPADCRMEGEACPPRYYCDENTGFCAVGCTSNADCAGGSFCELASHACLCPTEGEVLCGDTCVEEAPLSCGVTCESCNAPANGTAYCAEGACGFDCDAGHALCDGVCATCPTGSAVIATACLGATCVASECEPGHEICDGQCAPCPDAAPGSSLGCDGAQCVVTDCPAGTKLCNGTCAACPNDPNGTAQCSGNQCVLTCAGGFHDCGGFCESDTDATACGPSCVTCPTDPNGSAACANNSCTLTCQSGFRECNSSCAACPGGPSVVSTRCAGSSCVVDSCAAGAFPCAAGCCQYPPIGEIMFVLGSETSTSLKLDSQGLPHLAFAAGGEVFYAWWDGNQWASESVGVGDRVALALDASDGAHIAAEDTTFGAEEITFAQRLGGSWSQIPVSSIGLGGTPDIIIDNVGDAHITFKGTGGTLSHATESSGWEVDLVDSGNLGSHSSLARLGTTLHVAYFDEGANNLYHRTLAAGAALWSDPPHNVNGSVVATYGDTAIAIGPNGQGFVAFESFAGIGAARWTGTLWGDRGNVANGGSNPDIALDGAGTPYIVFKDFNFDLALAVRDNFGNWDVSVLDDVGASSLPQIEIDPTGTAHVVYFRSGDLLYTRF